MALRMLKKKRSGEKMSLAAQNQELMNIDVFWQAVVERNNQYDDQFVYAVRSTGVFCRPSCPSRRPDPKHVSFFLSPVNAEAEGYRACKRCKPNEESPRVALIQKVCRFIEQNLDQPIRLSALSKETGLTTHHLLRTFKRALGITPRQYADQCRLKFLKSGLREGNGIAEAIYGAGYGSASRIYERSNEQFGMTPRTYVQGGKGMRIRYTIQDSPLGRLLLGATDRGVSAVSIGNEDAQLLRSLRLEYPQAEIVEDDGRLQSWSKLLLRHLKGETIEINLPLDVKATAFQRRVWEELRKIPYGETKSYSEIARRIGQPKATRAVARACGANPAAVVIPCHRVISKNGEFGGYKWGRERKLHLLQQEKEKKPRRHGDTE
jgi:AraC family transcriptional regulator of adaptative response/methylated-DNA-[protein]-cysteine methyltransferase